MHLGLVVGIRTVGMGAYTHYRVRKKYPLKLLAIFWATALNFNAKFHTFITCSYLGRAAFDTLRV